jgi:cytochrome c biogenesis protein CcmG/thiol:disulfide interchange protein DsbE
LPRAGRPCHYAIVMKTSAGLTLLACSLPTLLFALSAYAADVGSPAPALSLPTATGEAIALDRLRGKVLYVDFWASWCGPCRKSFPWMADMQKKYGASGFAVIAVNVDKKRPDAEKFLQTTPAEFTVVYDPTGAAPTAWAVKAMPSSFLVDAKGNVALVESGFRDENAAELEGRIKALLAAK